MLVLTRKIGESIDFGDGLSTVEVLAIHRGKVKLGIVAPKGLPVHRSEVQAKIRTEQPQRPDTEAA